MYCTKPSTLSVDVIRIKGIYLSIYPAKSFSFLVIPFRCLLGESLQSQFGVFALSLKSRFLYGKILEFPLNANTLTAELTV